MLKDKTFGFDFWGNRSDIKTKLSVLRLYCFCGSFMFFLFVLVMPLCVSVYLCLVVTCWERADLLARICS